MWTLLWAAVWYGIWALTGARGVALLALDWRFFAPTALGVAVVALGVGLAADQRARSDGAPRIVQPQTPAVPPAPGGVARQGAPGASNLRIVIVSIVLVLAAAAGLEWMLSMRDEGPYPFADVPKGGLIAYSAPDGIRLVRSDGGRSWLVAGTGSMFEPVWAPDGNRLAAAELDGGFETYSFAADGSARTRLPFDVETTPVWSPDGRRLAVVAGDTSIRVVRPADGFVEAVLPIPGNEPAWSPDGNLIAFQGDGDDGLLQIYVVRSDGSRIRSVTTSRGADAENRIGAHSAEWAPNGRRLAFASDLDGDDDIYVVRPNGTGMRKVTRNAVDDSNPTWSPDGRRIAFDRTDYQRDRRAIVIVDLATGAETEIAHSDGDFVSEPAWQTVGIE